MRPLRLQPRNMHGLLQYTTDIANRLGDMLMPRRCVFCGTVSASDERFICRGCAGDLPWNRCCCRVCARPLPDADGVCSGCRAGPPPFTAAAVPLRYAYPVDAAIRGIKFRRQLMYAPAFADILLAATRRLPADVDALMPVPLHRWRQLRRGYNQARELARPVARRLGLPLADVARRTRATPYQSGLDAIERQQNLARVFAIRGPLDARHVVIVDDVVTTGATCRELAECLLANGVERVSVLALARA